MGYPFALSLRRTESESRISRNKKFFEIIIIWPISVMVSTSHFLCENDLEFESPMGYHIDYQYLTSLLSSIGRAADLIQDDPLRRIGLT